MLTHSTQIYTCTNKYTHHTHTTKGWEKKFNSKVLAYHVQGPGLSRNGKGREKGREEKGAEGGREKSREHSSHLKYIKGAFRGPELSSQHPQQAARNCLQLQLQI